jgi:hypothetical protein
MDVPIPQKNIGWTIRLRPMARILPTSCVALPKEPSRSVGSSQSAEPLNNYFFPAAVDFNDITSRLLLSHYS